MTSETAIKCGSFLTNVQELASVDFETRVQLSKAFLGLIYDLELSHGVAMPESRERNIEIGLMPFIKKYERSKTNG